MINRLAFLVLALSVAGAGGWWSWRRAHLPQTERAAEVARKPLAVRFVEEPVEAAAPVAAVPAVKGFVTVTRRQSRWDRVTGSSMPDTNDTLSSEESESTPLPSREELEFRALKVEQEANHELQNLLGVLELTDDQQDRVFAAIARRSTYYHPALQMQNTGGGTLEVPPSPVVRSNPSATAPSQSLAANSPTSPATALANDPVAAEIPHELIPRYREYKDEREEFWAGVVEKIESQINESGSGE
jgi:hypothetical protein